jgi:hypothetical protein
MQNLILIKPTIFIRDTFFQKIISKLFTLLLIFKIPKFSIQVYLYYFEKLKKLLNLGIGQLLTRFNSEKL